MADLKTESIAISKIKVRWEEPYVSEGVNRQMTGLPPGIYRGGQIAPASTPDLTFEIGPDVEGSGLFTDSFYVYRDSSNGFALAVNDVADVSFDMSARFTDPGPAMPGDETWWVWLDVTYATSNPTTADYRVTDTTPPDDAVIIGKIEMLSGDTSVIETRFVRTVRTEPVPAKRKDGAYVAGDEWIGFLSGEEAWNIPTSAQKDALDASSTPTTSNPLTTYDDFLGKYVAQPAMESKTISPAGVKFQINTNVYVKESKASSGDFARWVKVFPDDWTHADGDKPLVGSDGQQIPVLRLLRSDGTTPLVDGDADSDGFYQNPYVELDFSSTTDSTYDGDLKVFYFKRQLHNVVWGETPKNMMPFAWFQQRYHTNKVMAPDVTDLPESLNSGTLTSQLVALLGFINDRIINPTANPVEPVLIWRSHNITSDAAVTGKTASTYVSNNGLFLITGGYMNSSGEIVKAPVSELGITMLRMHGDADEPSITFATKDDPTTNLDPDDSADWDTYTQNSPSYGFRFKKGGVRIDDGAFLTTMAGSTFSMGGNEYISGAVDLDSGGSFEAKSGSTVNFQGTTELEDTTLDLTGGTGESDLPGSIKGQESPTYYRELFRSGGSVRSRIYYYDSELMITINAKSAVGGGWVAESAVQSAFAIKFYSSGIAFLSKSRNDGNLLTPGWDWNTSLTFGINAADKETDGTFIYNCFLSLGDAYEEVKYAVGGTNVGSTAQQLTSFCNCNFRNRYGNIPTNLTKVPEVTSNPGTATIKNASRWGFHIEHTSVASLSPTATWQSIGYYRVYP